MAGGFDKQRPLAESMQWIWRVQRNLAAAVAASDPQEMAYALDELEMIVKRDPDAAARAAASRAVAAFVASLGDPLKAISDALRLGRSRSAQRAGWWLVLPAKYSDGADMQRLAHSSLAALRGSSNLYAARGAVQATSYLWAHGVGARPAPTLRSLDIRGNPVDLDSANPRKRVHLIAGLTVSEFAARQIEAIDGHGGSTWDEDDDGHAWLSYFDRPVSVAVARRIVTILEQDELPPHIGPAEMAA